MKKILSGAGALLGLCAPICADVWVEGRGQVELNAFKYTHGYGSLTNPQGNTYPDPTQIVQGFSAFNEWDTSDTDIWVRGDWDRGGFNLNLSFDGLGDPASYTGGSPLPIRLGDWSVWIALVDFYRPVYNSNKLFYFAFRFLATNEDNRFSNRYNDIIHETESYWGTLILGDRLDIDRTFGANAEAHDDDSFKGYIVQFDTSIIRVDLGFNSRITDNIFNITQNYPSMLFDSEKEIGAGARMYLPIDNVLNFGFFTKVRYSTQEENVGTINLPPGMRASFGAIFDIRAIRNFGFAFGYIGHWDDTVGFNSPNITNNATIERSRWLTHAADIRLQYLGSKFGFALHNNITFVLPQNELLLANKTNMGFLYAITDSFSFITELQNYYWRYTTQFSANQGVRLAQFDTVTVYPRFELTVVPNQVMLKFGLRVDFEFLAENKMELDLTDEEGNPIDTSDLSSIYPKRVEVSLPLSLEVRF